MRNFSTIMPHDAMMPELSQSPSSVDHPLNKRLLLIFTLIHFWLIFEQSPDIAHPVIISVLKMIGVYLMPL